MPSPPDGTGAMAPGRAEWLRALLTVPYLALALLFGGGAGPLVDGAIELGGLLIGAVALAAFHRPLPLGSRSGFALLGFIVLVIAWQLIPLPVAWPGHETAEAIREATGLSGAATPLTLDPGATRRSALSLLPAIGIYLALLPASTEERRRAVMVVAGIALFSLLLGAVQVTTGGFYPYPTAHNRNPVGIFTNRNHQADLLIAGMVMTAVIGRRFERRAAVRLVAAAVILLFAFAVVTTISRAGTALMVPALAASLLLLMPIRRGTPRLVIGGAIVAAFVGAAFIATNPVIQSTLQRFAGGRTDLRFDYWKDTLIAIRAYWPTGSGLGTFVPVYAAVQDLGSVGVPTVNHAHNDYLELVLETGLAALIGIVAYLAILARHAARLGRGALRIERAGALVVLCVLLAHSAADYPLRMLTLMTLFGAMTALLIEPVRRAQS